MDKTIKDIIKFYAKTHYDNYLEEHNITKISDDDIYIVICQFYNDDKKKNIREFVIDTYKKLCDKNKSEYPGDLVIKNILFDIFHKDEDEFIKQRIVLFIKEHQENIN